MSRSEYNRNYWRSNRDLRNAQRRASRNQRTEAEVTARNAYEVTWRAANPVRAKGYHLLSQYGLTLRGYWMHWYAQAEACAICRRAFDPLHAFADAHVDHCHTTNKVRGLLCRACNTAIGKLGDDATGVRRALRYLERFEEGPAS